MRSKWLMIVSFLMLVSMILGACAKAPTAPTKTLRINLTSWPEVIDPQKSPFGTEIAHLKLIYEGLTRLDKDLNTVPGAAEKWEYNNDATVLTFNLRDDLKYSDGSLLNARRFEYSILRNIDPTTAGEYTSFTDDIVGAVEWRSADLSTTTPTQLADLKAAVGIHAIDGKGVECTSYDQTDCNTLQITLKQPTPYFHTVMSLWVTYPAKQELIEKGGANWYTDPQYQIGNGPMVLSEFEATAQSIFTPNPTYWRGTAKINIQYKYIIDSSVALASYKGGELDIIHVGAEDLSTIKNDAVLSKELLFYPGSCTYALMFHQLKAPFTDQKVREAFAYGLNRDAYIADVLKGLGKSTLTWIPEGFPGYDAQENRWGYDPEKAKQALAESSYGSAENLPTITLTYPDNPRNRTRFEWIAAQYQALFGIEMPLDPVESTAFTALTKNVDTAPQAFILSWCADYPDPQNWLSAYWKTGAFGENIGYSNLELDALLAKADSSTNPSERMTLYAQAQVILTSTAPAAFWYNTVNTYLVKPNISGILTTAMDSDWAGSIDPLSITIEG